MSDSPKFIAYYRVSTAKQGASGLGLEAQRALVDRHLASVEGAELVYEFTEIESGRKAKRPQLDAALWQCKRHNATLIIAKLDRLARNVHFISGLMESGVEFVACDNPQANRLVLHILAAVAEDEARAISQRTKAALAAAKARGVKLGENGKALATRNKAASQAHAELIAPMIAEISYAERNTVTKMAEALNRYDVPTMKGGRWSRKQVYRLRSISSSVELAHALKK